MVTCFKNFLSAMINPHINFTIRYYLMIFYITDINPFARKVSLYIIFSKNTIYGKYHRGLLFSTNFLSAE